GLDPSSAYRMRIVYGPDKPEIKLRCVANEKYEVHGWINKPKVQGPMEFDIPREATSSGMLNLTWTREPGFGGNGRGCQVCEIWLIKKWPSASHYYRVLRSWSAVSMAMFSEFACAISIRSHGSL